MGMPALDLDEDLKMCGGVIADKTLDAKAFSSLVLKDLVMTQFKVYIAFFKNKQPLFYALFFMAASTVCCHSQSLAVCTLPYFLSCFRLLLLLFASIVF